MGRLAAFASLEPPRPGDTVEETTVPLTNSADSYGWVHRGLHWLVAAFIICQYVLAELAEGAEDAGSRVTQLALMANHKSLGITILALALLRLLWRLANAPPPLPATMKPWERWLSQGMHWALYALIVALPLSGWLYSSATAYSVSWFNLVTLPDLVSPDEDLKATLHEVHEIGGKLLFVLAILHALAALKHWLWDRDGVLGRMLGAGSGLLFVAALAGAFWSLMDVSAPSPARAPAAAQPPATASTPATTSTDDAATAPDTTVPLWDIDRSASFIRFRGTQAGAGFDGTWQRWEAEIRFDPARLADSRARVTVATDSASTGDAERDSTMQEPDWFAVDDHPRAEFVAGRFEALPDGRFTTDARLRMKGIDQPLRFTFTLTQADDGVSLTGEARIDRLRWNLGMGEWQDTSWVGQQVDVEVRVSARR